MKVNLWVWAILGISLASIAIFFTLNQENKDERISEIELRLDENKDKRISEIELRLDEIKEMAAESKIYVSQFAYFECRKDIPRYTSNLTNTEYYDLVNGCYTDKVDNETRKLKGLNSERISLTEELKSLTSGTKN